MPESQTKEFPFSLTELTLKEDHKIPVYPENQHWLAAMKEQYSQHPEDSIPVQKLMSCLVEFEGEEGVWGLKMPKKSCIFVAERQLIKKQASARDKAIAKYFRLMQKISKKLKKPQKQVQKMLSRTFEYLDVLDPWLEEITSATAELEATDITVATVTIMVQQRLTKSWTEFDTLALPESLFHIFLDYCESEERAWKEKEIEVEIDDDDEIIEGETTSYELEATSSPNEGNEPKQITPASTD